MKFVIQGQEVDPLKLQHREATTEERKKMLGSLATLYEMKIPLLHCVGTNIFFVIGDTDSTIELVDDNELVILHTDIELPSIFRKWKKRPKLSKKWQ